MSDAVILFDNVWKKFRLGERHNSLRDLIPSMAKSLFSSRNPVELADQEFWAVRDVSFAVKHGEALGIIGPNGAGKSTTLKLLTRILKPTRGRCFIHGRTGALIEIAAGFHPDLTGRENIYLQGAIMGMKRGEIASHFDEIVDFAGVSEFVDTQVKRYSSGMNARLGFSIAAHLNPNALVIDEVLSVGDVAFQQKCIQRMHEFKRSGVAIVFVSHNLQAVNDLCDQALYLKRHTISVGRPGDVIEHYLQDSYPVSQVNKESIVIEEASLIGPTGSHGAAIKPGSQLSLFIRAHPKTTIRDYHIGFLVFRSTDQLSVYDGNWTGEELGCPELCSGSPIEFNIRFIAHLTKGHYYVSWHLFHNPTQTFLSTIRPAGFFAIDENRTWGGVADLEVTAKAST